MELPKIKRVNPQLTVKTAQWGQPSDEQWITGKDWNDLADRVERIEEWIESQKSESQK